jgi:hypothetical protein
MDLRIAKWGPDATVHSSISEPSMSAMSKTVMTPLKWDFCFTPEKQTFPASVGIVSNVP